MTIYVLVREWQGGAIDVQIIDHEPEGFANYRRLDDDTSYYCDRTADNWVSHWAHEFDNREEAEAFVETFSKLRNAKQKETA